MLNQVLNRKEDPEYNTKVEETNSKDNIPTKNQILYISPIRNVKNIEVQNDELIDLNESEKNSNSVLKETDEASNQENNKNYSQDENDKIENNSQNNDKIDYNKEKDLNKKYNQKLNNKIKNAIIDNYINNPNSLKNNSINETHYVNQNLCLNEFSSPSSNEKVSIKVKKIKNPNNSMNNSYSIISYEDLNNSCLESAEISQENQTKKNENYTLLPIETKYFKLSKDTRATHIPNIQDFECLACFHIVNDPKVCAECEKLVCQECLETWWSEKTSKDKECIHCKKTFYDLFMPRIVRNSLNSIVIKCPNKNGCKANFEYQHLLKHLEVCKFTRREAVCNFCREVFNTTNEKCEILKHLAECPLANVICQFCDKTVSRKKLLNHQAKCERQFSKCRDCDAKMQIFDMKNHSKIECIENIKNKLYREIKEKDDKITELEHYREDYAHIKKLNSLVPYIVRFLINKHKIKNEEKLAENQIILDKIFEKFGINSDNYGILTKQELLYQYYYEVKSLSKDPVKVINSNKNYGKIYYENGNLYEGKILHNLPNGKGQQTKLIPFITYKGEFKDGRFNGEGKYYYTDGAKYSGGFSQDKKNGKGILSMPNGHKYEGEFKNQSMTGFGTYTYENGNKYVGFFNDGVKQGEGCEYFCDGDLHFKGFFEKDKKNGYGVLFEKKTVKTFEGQFTNGKPNEENALFSLKTL